ncbi:DNA-binding protein [Marivirga lumbricoides]|uniref:DNA-binding protein n=1 Tax=Marivirga lumbricoides TaxID=1046115 RepID=A0A2T4DVZ7_9BACT|nr:DNA-binding protein [Marivirga lumbricoides]
MKSPITGKEMKIISDKQKLTFRKEEFELSCKFYVCEDTGEKFTDTKLDEWNMTLLHNLYRAKHNIPSIEEIKAIREQYDLSATQMGGILGFGANTYRLYEKGDVPTIPNARLIKSSASPKYFKTLVEDWKPEKKEKRQKLLSLADKKIDEQRKKNFSIELKEHLLGGDDQDEFTGFRKPSFERFAEMIVFFSHHAPCYKTKMNKLLFYADFYAFKHFGISISGSKYRAIPYGPVPFKYESIFEELTEKKLIDIYFDDSLNYKSEKLKARDDRKFNEDLFSDQEIKILNLVAERFKNLNTKAIVKISHEETAWIQNNANRELISYQFAVDLKGI